MVPMLSTRGALNDFRADLARYPRGSWFSRRQLWAVAVYRLGAAGVASPGARGALLRAAYRPLYLLAQILTGVEIPARAAIGPGLYIAHAGPVTVHSDASVGPNATLNIGTVIGATGEGGAPRIGANLRMGAYSQIIGEVVVGNDVTLGSLTLLNRDAAAGSILVGIPARSVKQ